MPHSAFDPRLPDLPDTVPIFPLPGALLLPGSNLPLNIFEPRYLNMVNDALGAGRIIGMIQPDPARSGGGETAVYRVGCAGRITAFNETDDGRFLINLRGVCRFEVREEMEPVRGYRRVRPAWGPFGTDLAEPPELALDRARFRDVLARYFEAHSLRVDWEALEKLPDGSMVDFLSMNLPFEPEEKQALLECENPGCRAETLIALAEMAARSATGPAAPEGRRH